MEHPSFRLPSVGATVGVVTDAHEDGASAAPASVSVQQTRVDEQGAKLGGLAVDVSDDPQGP